MARSVRFRGKSRAHLKSLYDYIAAESGHDRAIRYVDSLEAACLRLGDFPGMGRRAEQFGSGCRLHPQDRRAIILYRVTDDSVDILGIYYGGQDLRAIGPFDD